MQLSAALVTDKTNIAYFSGFTGSSGILLLFFKDRNRAPAGALEGSLFTDARYHIVARKVLPRGFKIIDTTAGFAEAFGNAVKKHRLKKIGIEEGNMTLKMLKALKKSAQHVKFADIGEKLNEIRMIKRPHELKAIIAAQNITDKIFAELKRRLRVGASEREIAWKIETLSREFGAEDISFTPIVAINEHSAAPHHQNTQRRIKKGDMILIDMGVKYNGYCSDMTRVLFTKTPTGEQRKIYELVLLAQETAIRGLKPGITGAAADKISRDIIIKAGYGEKFGHSLGHGVGLDVHELPNLSSKYKGKIPAGAVVTVEPGAYLPGKFGVRLEDIVKVERNGAKNITKSAKDIQKCIIKI